MGSTKLSFEYIAIKEINEGDEILIDYGDEWQEAWDKHVEKWMRMPVENAENLYIIATTQFKHLHYQYRRKKKMILYLSTI